jgi:hypothetical protein
VSYGRYFEWIDGEQHFVTIAIIDFPNGRQITLYPVLLPGLRVTADRRESASS